MTFQYERLQNDHLLTGMFVSLAPAACMSTSPLAKYWSTCMNEWMRKKVLYKSRSVYLMFSCCIQSHLEIWGNPDLCISDPTQSARSTLRNLTWVFQFIQTNTSDVPRYGRTMWKSTTGRGGKALRSALILILIRDEADSGGVIRELLQMAAVWKCS